MTKSSIAADATTRNALRKSKLSFRIVSFSLATAMAVAFIGTSPPVHAFETSSMAATCTVGDPAIQNNLYTIMSGSVQHQEGKIGLITLYCPIPPSLALPPVGATHGYWFMTFFDPDGPSNNYYIQSQIIRSDKSGHVSAVAQPLRSNSST